ncbi:MAG: ComEC/Rec2 family competence protein [Pseudomonadota bacterium]
MQNFFYNKLNLNDKIEKIFSLSIIYIKNLWQDLLKSHHYLLVIVIGAFITGIAFTFAIGFAPSNHMLWLILSLAISMILIKKTIPGWSIISKYMIVPFLLGFVWMGFKINAISKQKIPYPIYGVHVFKGQIENISFSKRNTRLTLKPIAIDHQTLEPHFWKIHISSRRKTNLNIGQIIEVKARVLPPYDPVWTSGYDPRQRAFFDHFAGTGYALSTIKILKPQHLETPHHFKHWVYKIKLAINQKVNQWRLNLRSYLYQRLKQNDATFATALMLGERHEIAEDQLQDLRASGLAHLLAISGLHMGLVMGGIFALSRGIMAMIPPLALNFPIKKIAGLFSLIAGFAYLLISGFSIPTQRAFVMGLVAIIALWLNWPVISIHLVAVAALCVAIIAPHSVMTASFQLSFAAVGALVFWFSKKRKKYHMLETEDTHLYQIPQARWKRFIVQLLSASAIASIATQPLSAAFFGVVTPWGIFANILAVPIASVITMPSLFAILIPGLDSIASSLFSFSLHLILSIADFIHALPASKIAIAQMQNLPLFILAALAFFSMVTYRRVQMILLICFFITYPLIFLFQKPKPFIIIDPAGKKTAIRTGDNEWMLLGGVRRGYVHNVWRRKLGITQFKNYKSIDQNCFKDQCVLSLNDLKIGWFNTKKPNLDLLCTDFDILIVTKHKYDRTQCSEQNISYLYDKSKSWENGTQMIYDHHILEFTSDRDLRGRYPWVGWQFVFSKDQEK